jgi:hypothetical protein
LGVHFNNYYPGQWNKSNDWSWQGITGSYSETKYVTVYDNLGNLIYGNEPDSTQTSQPPSITVADVFGFEDTSGWIAPAGIATRNTTNKTQGSASLRISGGGYQTINSIDLSTAKITGETSTLKLDFYIGATQPNRYWIGQVQLFASCPSAGLYNAYIGQCELTGLPYSAFSTLSFTLSGDVLAILRGNYTDFSFKWALNTNSGSGPYLLDNMRFTN